MRDLETTVQEVISILPTKLDDLTMEMWDHWEVLFYMTSLGAHINSIFKKHSIDLEANNPRSNEFRGALEETMSEVLDGEEDLEDPEAVFVCLNRFRENVQVLLVKYQSDAYQDAPPTWVDELIDYTAPDNVGVFTEEAKIALRAWIQNDPKRADSLAQSIELARNHGFAYSRSELDSIVNRSLREKESLAEAMAHVNLISSIVDRRTSNGELMVFEAPEMTTEKEIPVFIVEPKYWD